MVESVKVRGLHFIFILLMSGYVLFENINDKESITLEKQLDRHERMLEGRSEFFNPWQYRVFSMYVLEGFIRIYNWISPGPSEIYPYLLLRLFQNMLIFYLCLYYYKALGITNTILIMAGLIILCLTYGNSSFHSDLSFNTYFDIIFYIGAALLILNMKDAWIIPLSFFASLNRETSGFIPLMVLMPFSWKELKRRKIIIASLSLAFFTIAFVGVRIYYGYRETESIHGMSNPWEFFQHNIGFMRMYPLLLGTLSIIPIAVILQLKKLPLILQQWFWLIVPAWVLIHLFFALTAETRLFLVPHTLLFVPSFLLLIERWYSNPKSEPIRN